MKLIMIKFLVSRRKKGIVIIIKLLKRFCFGGNISMGLKKKVGKIIKSVGFGVLLFNGDIGSDFVGGVSEFDSGLYCFCCGFDNYRFMIVCDCCEDWFYGDCIGMDKWIGENFVQKYICFNCSDFDWGYVICYKKMCSYLSCKNVVWVGDFECLFIFCLDDYC